MKRILSLIIFCIIAISANARDVVQDFNLSRDVIEIGNIFSQKHISIYGILDKEKYDHSMLVYLDDTNYNIQSKKRTNIGLVKVSNEKTTNEYYGFLHIITDNDGYKKYLKYQSNDTLDNFLSNNELLTINQKQFNAKQNGLFNEKIYIPKMAKAGTYNVEIYSFDKQTKQLAHLYKNTFEIKITGDVGFIKNFSKHNKIKYIIISIATTIACGLFIALILDLYSKISCKN
jgi:hypothetical protein